MSLKIMEIYSDILCDAKAAWAMETHNPFQS